MRSIDIDALNRHTLAWADEVNATGLAFITPFVLDGVWAVRISVGAQPTTREDVAAVWELVRTLAEGRSGSIVGRVSSPGTVIPARQVEADRLMRRSR